MSTVINDKTIVDRTGATVGYYEFGDPLGKPVFAFHGTPSCGAGFSFADAPARERRLRIIAPDRPGVGRSTRRANYRVGDYPAMLADFAGAMKIDRFGVWGYSGGGPYAVACVAKLGNRIDAGVISAGMGEIGVYAHPNDFERTDRQMLGLAVKHPAIARRIMGVASWVARKSPMSAMKSMEKQLDVSDRAVIANYDDPKQIMAMFTQAFTNGPHGVVTDYASLARSWECDLSAVTIPVTIFQGTADKMVPFRHAEQLTARLPKSTLKVWEGEGHLATVKHVDEILDCFV